MIEGSESRKRGLCSCPRYARLSRCSCCCCCDARALVIRRRKKEEGKGNGLREGQDSPLRRPLLLPLPSAAVASRLPLTVRLLLCASAPFFQKATNEFH